MKPETRFAIFPFCGLAGFLYMQTALQARRIKSLGFLLKVTLLAVILGLGNL